MGRIRQFYLLSIAFILVNGLAYSIFSAKAWANYDLLIIGPESYKLAMRDFINYKRKQGVETLYKSVETINANYNGLDIVTKIHDCVRDELYKSAIKYLMIVGDYEQVPTRYVYSPSFEYGIADFNYKPTDWYYAVPNWEDSEIGTLNGNVPQIAVGRLPVHDEEELKDVILKIIDVENNLNVSSLLILDGLGLIPEDLPHLEHVHYDQTEEVTSYQLSKTLNEHVAYVVSYSHGSPSTLFSRDEDGECKIIMDIGEAREIKSRYGIHYMVACFTGALDLENESLARALSVSPYGPALVIASSRIQDSQDPIATLFWDSLVDTGNVGAAVLKALRLYLSDPEVLSSDSQSFFQYNQYLTKVIYGDISWKIDDHRSDTEGAQIDVGASSGGKKSIAPALADTSREGSYLTGEIFLAISSFPLFACLYLLHSHRRARST